MRRLIVVRHAKSDWGNFKLADFDRPLNDRGHQNAPEMAQRLVSANIIPNKIVSSPALRAITTANYFAEVWQIDANTITTNLDVYESSVNTLLQTVTKFDNTAQTIALFGHNPGLTGLVAYLTDDFFMDMPTCSVVVISFEFDDWRMLSNGTGTLVHFDFPKSGLD